MHPPPAIAAVLLLLGCETAGIAEPESALAGSWGGHHVSLVLEPGGGRLEYNCAAGEIYGPLRPDARGRFAATGIHIPGHGGPDRVGEAPPRLPAEYSGRVEGEVMALRVRVPSTGVDLGPFALRRGAEPVILRCL